MVNIKPLSVNEAWKGRRFKSQKYKDFERSLLFILPPKIELPAPPFEISFVFGVSSPLADWDNPIKPHQDVIAKKYRFNDKLIMKGSSEKIPVKKGDEFFSFEITHYEANKT